jgi:hypothetical protein
VKPLGRVEVQNLILDPQNPRLPEKQQGGNQASILKYLDENDVLDELIDSYIANGFFENEPLLVLEGPAGAWIVVEGNRRAAALMRLLGTEAAQDAELVVDASDKEVPAGRLEQLATVPVFQLDDRGEVSRYLGFRHISGLKTWGAEAKSRYLWLQVEDAAASGVKSPFYVVGRQVGSNSAGVRTAYNAFNLLRGAESLGVDADVEFVKRKRFGVWTRLLGTANVPLYMGIDGDRGASYTEVKQRAEQLIPERTAEVLQDLKPRSGRRTAVLADSRDVTDYSDVLGNPRALQVLREYDNLSLAVQVVGEGQLGDRLSSLVDSVEVLTRQVPRMSSPTPHEVAAAKELRALTRALLGVIESRAEDEDEDED